MRRTLHSVVVRTYAEPEYCVSLGDFSLLRGSQKIVIASFLAFPAALYTNTQSQQTFPIIEISQYCWENNTN
jgi:hypothetical protein